MVNVEILTLSKNRFMFIDGDLWMWDTQRERELQESLAKKAFGDVLVAGYGFGIVAKYLLHNPKVKSVLTVEKHKEVIDALSKNEKIWGSVKIKDFYDLDEKIKFDCIIGDIWQDIDSQFLPEYKKFKEKALRVLRKDGEILAWGKDYFEYLINYKSQLI